MPACHTAWLQVACLERTREVHAGTVRRLQRNLLFLGILDDRYIDRHSVKPFLAMLELYRKAHAGWLLTHLVLAVQPRHMPLIVKAMAQ